MRSCGMRIRLYSAIMVGLMLLLMAYSTTTWSASGQRIIPIDGFSLERFTSVLPNKIPTVQGREDETLSFSIPQQLMPVSHDERIIDLP